VLRGLHDVPDGRRFCVYTRLGRVGMATLTRPPRLQREDLVFDYVVWQGTAPPVSPAIPAAPGTELRRAAITLPDPMGLDIDGTVSVVPQDDSRVDVTPYGKGSVLSVADSALIGVLPVGSTPTYAACASLPAATRTTAVPELRSLPRGQSICLYSYPGRVAMLTPVRPTDDGHPDLALTIVVWQGPPTVGIPGQEPARGTVTSTPTPLAARRRAPDPVGSRGRPVRLGNAWATHGACWERGDPPGGVVTATPARRRIRSPASPPKFRPSSEVAGPVFDRTPDAPHRSARSRHPSSEETSA
jgi:hypothetical protein